MRVGSRELHRDLERLEEANRVLRGNQTRLAGLLELDPGHNPVVKLLRAYLHLADAAWPAPSSSVAAPGGGNRSQFDRPAPGSATAMWREGKELVDRVLAEAADAAEEMFENPKGARIRLQMLCGHCGCDGRDHTHRKTAIRAASDFLSETLRSGPVEASLVITRAEEAGIRERTLERASSREVRGRRLVTKYQELGRWWWRLT
jgi:hypothetical protein